MTKFDAVTKQLESVSYTWVVTGVAGFVGSHLLEFLLSHHQKVIGIDNFLTGSRSNLELVREGVGEATWQNFSFHEIDIRDQEKCEEAMEGADFLLHQAALGSVPRSLETPELTTSVNVQGFVSVLNAARKNKLRKSVYASSSSVYGDSAALPKVEHTIGNPLSPYAASKRSNELYAAAYGHAYGMAIVGLRYFNIFGPRQNPQGPYAAVIPLWIRSLLDGRPTYINGPGEISRDFTYVMNAVQANILAAFDCATEPCHQVFNVGAGHRTTLLDLHQMIRETLGMDTPPLHRAYRPGDIHHSHANIDAITSVLSYQPTHTVAEGLKLTCDRGERHGSPLEGL
jgi:UDP-N-acetylglucosamine 4-epimerase